MEVKYNGLVQSIPSTTMECLSTAKDDLTLCNIEAYFIVEIARWMREYRGTDNAKPEVARRRQNREATRDNQTNRTRVLYLSLAIAPSKIP